MRALQSEGGRGLPHAGRCRAFRPRSFAGSPGIRAVTSAAISTRCACRVRACRRRRRGLPLVIYSNHASWWDPLVGLVLKSEFFADRTPFAPMDAAMLERYKLFARLGFFGVEQHSRRGAIAFSPHGRSRPAIAALSPRRDAAKSLCRRAGAPRPFRGGTRPPGDARGTRAFRAAALPSTFSGRSGCRKSWSALGSRWRCAGITPPPLDGRRLDQTIRGTARGGSGCIGRRIAAPRTRLGSIPCCAAARVREAFMIGGAR